MIRSFLLSVSFSLCWTLSPDVLVLLGNGFGRHGKDFALALLAGAVLSAAAARIIHRHPAAPAAEQEREPRPGTGFFTATLNLAGALSPAFLLPTGMLVTAGFTFNETFVYWFPNFAFSYLLLLLVVAVHLAGERAVLAAQQVFFLLTASCLLLLCLAGLLTAPAPPQEEPAAPAGIGPALALTPLAMLFFLGYDQQLPNGEGKQLQSGAAVGVGFLLLALWGLASLQHVPQQRLAESSVPYVAAARAILDQTGRFVMGIAVISGTCGVVSGLFSLASGVVRRLLVGSRQGPDDPRQSLHPKIQAILMALAVALFMALGLAGSDRLEIWIFGALLLWLLSVGASCVTAGQRLHRQQVGYASLGYAIGGLILAAVAYLAFTYPEQEKLFGFCVPVLIASGLLAAILDRVWQKIPSGNKHHKRRHL